MRNFIVFTICLALLFAPEGLAIDLSKKAKPSKPSTKLKDAAKLADYNKLKIPQFQTKPVEGILSILNGGIGNGTNQSFFCNGTDEAWGYNLLNSGPNSWDPNISQAANQGTYNVVRLIDRCRVEGGCGDVPADKKFFVIGTPTHATNCHSWGKRAVFEELIYENPPPGGPSSNATPLGRNYPAWQGRNYINDTVNAGFLYSRYLIRQLDRSAVTGEALLNVNEEDLKIHFGGNAFTLFGPSPYYADIPWSGEHSKWGFTCAQVSKNEGYKSNPLIQASEVTELHENIDDDWRVLQKNFLLGAVNQLGEEIAQGKYGNLYPNTPGKWEELALTERQQAQVVVSIHAILKEMIDKVRWTDGIPTGSGPNKKIRFKSSTKLPDATLVNYVPGDEVIYILNTIAEDCHSARSSLGDPAKKFKKPGSENWCAPSYGQWWGVGNKLYERVGTAGFTLKEAQGHMVAQEGSYEPATGYGPVIASLIAHQLIHAYFQRKLGVDRMKGWPTDPTALYEEELAVMAQSVVFMKLVSPLNKLPSDFSMTSASFVRSVTTNAQGDVTDVTKGKRYYYPSWHYPIGFGGIYLGPFYANMRNINKNLWEKRPDQARMLALYHALAPTLHPPQMMTKDGVEQPFGP